MTTIRFDDHPIRWWWTMRHPRHAERPPRPVAFQQCELCDYDFATGEGERGCHYYECPYLPEELDVLCPTCRFNFYVMDGQPECSDPPSCDFARRIAPVRVARLRRWLGA